MLLDIQQKKSRIPVDFVKAISGPLGALLNFLFHIICLSRRLSVGLRLCIWALLSLLMIGWQASVSLDDIHGNEETENWNCAKKLRSSIKFFASSACQILLSTDVCAASFDIDEHLPDSNSEISN